MWFEYNCTSEQYLYFYFNEFEIIYLDSVYFVGVEPKSEGFLLLNC